MFDTQSNLARLDNFFSKKSSMFAAELVFSFQFSVFRNNMRSDTKEIYEQKVNQVIDFVSANPHQPLMLDEIAAHIFVSQRQLLRIMRTALNEPLSAYVARQRIERAVMYMQTEIYLSDPRKTEVAKLKTVLRVPVR